MARQPSYGIGRSDLPAIVNPTSGVNASGTGITRPVPEPTLGTGQRNPGIQAANSPDHVAPVQAMNPNLSPSTTAAASHMGGSPPVEVTATAKGFTGVNQSLINRAPAPKLTQASPTGPIKSVGGMYEVQGVKGPGFGGRFPTMNSAATAHQKRMAGPVYNQTLTGPGGVNVPIGSTGQSPAAQLAHPGAMAGIAESGSIQDVAAAQAITGKKLPVTADVQQAVNATGLTPSASYAKPKTPRGRK